jgi:hypothetical protein
LAQAPLQQLRSSRMICASTLSRDVGFFPSV